MTDHYCDKCHCERVPIPMDIGYVEWLCPECELYHESEPRTEPWRESE